MIAGIFHEGSGLGDQLFRYITVRTLAEDREFEWAMLNWSNFKGDFFDPNGRVGWAPQEPNYWNEKDVRDEHGNDIRSYDPDINFVEDNTIIDGSFEDDKYWRHNLCNINKWLTVEPLEFDKNTCFVGFRGGEYAAIPDLFLTEEYYDIARSYIPMGMKFEVHTDDPGLAALFFEDFGDVSIVNNQQISHSKHTNMGVNWRSARYARYAIVPNSAFFIIPRILKHHEDPHAVTIAPRYWAGRNTQVWKRPACYYKEFIYV